MAGPHACSGLLRLRGSQGLRVSRPWGPLQADAQLQVMPALHAGESWPSSHACPDAVMLPAEGLHVGSDGAASPCKGILVGCDACFCSAACTPCIHVETAIFGSSWLGSVILGQRAAGRSASDC